MKPLTHCLAATDLSASGNLAMARAMQLTQALGIPLDVLHVARPGATGPGAG